MKLNFFIFLFISLNIFQSIHSKSARCEYFDHVSVNGYTCVLKIFNYYGEDFTAIEGDHVDGFTDDDVNAVVSVEDSNSTYYPSFICEKFKNVKIIIYDEGGIERIDRNSLRNCKHLERLNLYNNYITELPEDIFIDTPNITLIGLFGNLIYKLPENVFSHLTQVQSMHLFENRFVELPETIFYGLYEIETMYLYENLLGDLPENIFKDQANVWILDLNGNLLNEVKPKWFANMENLNYLYLNKNSFKEIPKNSFVGLGNLYYLYLEKNELSDLPPGIFAPLVSLEYINLSYNKLKTLHTDSFVRIEPLIEILFAHNNLQAFDDRIINEGATMKVMDGTGNPCIDREGRFSDGTGSRRTLLREALAKCIAAYEDRCGGEVTEERMCALDKNDEEVRKLLQAKVNLNEEMRAEVEMLQSEKVNLRTTVDELKIEKDRLNALIAAFRLELVAKTEDFDAQLKVLKDKISELKDLIDKKI